MKIIKKLSHLIEDELHMSEIYIDKALEYNEEYPGVAKTLYQISMQEMSHVEMLHKEVAELIEQYRSEHGDPPVEMMAVYNYLHKKHIRHASSIKVKQQMFKG